MHNLFVDSVRKPAIPTESFGEYTPEPFMYAPQMERMKIHDMQSALNKLPAEQREVLLLVALEDIELRRSGRTLRIPVGTVMSRLSRVRERVRALMEGRVPTTSLKVVK